jgi:hypothetical protein
VACPTGKVELGHYKKTPHAAEVGPPDVERTQHRSTGLCGYFGVVSQFGYSLSAQTTGSARYAVENWSMTQSHLPSPCRRPIPAVGLPSGGRVEVNAKSPPIMAGRRSPTPNFRPVATSSGRTLGLLPCPASAARRRGQGRHRAHKGRPFRRRLRHSLAKPADPPNLEDHPRAHGLRHGSIRPICVIEYAYDWGGPWSDPMNR